VTKLVCKSPNHVEVVGGQQSLPKMVQKFEALESFQLDLKLELLQM